MRFARALGALCRGLGRARAKRYSRWILRYSRQFKVDPFLVAAVIHRRSQCRANMDGEQGIGLGRIRLRNHQRQIRRGWYRYWVLQGGRRQARKLRLNRFRLTRAALRRPQANLYFTAALLHVYDRQCPSLDAAHRGKPHRHAVSHYLWGGKVRSTRFEDQVLQSRRRILGGYHRFRSRPLASYREFPLHSPLDGAPRKISSRYNAWRAGNRLHKGVDFYSDYGEPVRAVADGVVVFAGVDLPGSGSAARLPPGRARRVPSRKMGRGGIFVLVDHGKGFTTGYFHLVRYTVKQGERVKGGDLLGFVGRTGIRRSAPHLHFEMRRHGRHFNPTAWLGPMLAPPERRKPAKKPRKRRRQKEQRRYLPPLHIVEQRRYLPPPHIS